ncbi:MAG: TetR/AcrR family transcriptional regulator [Ktedonobacteraceae bacterium]|nr:TetR/AcrR family transcriptional regulator [Ktedonobacteraceae bacterium]
MSKGEQTRTMILERTAQLFSCKGYFGASLSDIMEATGLEKGGIYNHFTSKEQLALEAFDYAFEMVQQQVRLALTGKKHAIERLIAYTTVFQQLVDNALLSGGCPVLNTAVEADDAHIGLRDRARNAMSIWRASISHIVAKGIERQEIRADVDIEAFTTVFIATLEGAVMLSKLYEDTTHMRRAIEHLTWYIDTKLKL